MASGNDQLVIAFFDSKQAADDAAEQLKGWDKANEDIKLGAIGVLTTDDNGKIKTRKYGPRNTGRGAKIGVAIGVVTAVLPPVGLVAGAATGLVAGGVIGSLSKKGLGMSDEDLQQISSELQGGHAALAVLAPPEEVAATTAELERLGGKTKSYDASEEDLQSAHQEIQASPEAAAAVAEAAAPEASASTASAGTEATAGGATAATTETSPSA
jgi:uncharacterized membrane protein